MIRAVRCDQPSFREVTFEKGFNVILAERTKESTQKDSRNGLGKSTLIEIIHFCLGASADKGTLTSPALANWTFFVEISLDGNNFTASRNTTDKAIITVEGDTTGWPIQPTADVFGNRVLSVDEWNTVLGIIMLGLPATTDKKYHPSFRSIFSYFARRGRDAFSNPFECHRKQKEWNIQVCNAFLLDLAWEDASDLQVLKDRQELVNNLKKAARTGVMDDVFGSVGELEARKVQMMGRVKQQSESLQNFQVHAQYYEIQEEVDRFTTEIQEAINANISDRQLLSLYQSSIEETKSSADESMVSRLYEEAGVALPEMTLRRLEEVELFHHRLIENRQQFLSNEVGRLQRLIADRELQIQQKTSARASLMAILQSHGALAEYTKLQERYTQSLSALQAVDANIANLRKFESGRTELKIEQGLLQRRMNQDYQERQTQRDRAITLFNANSEALYNAPGTLVIDVATTGFKFNVEIERSGSDGIENMKVFCYDLMLAQLWSERSPSPSLLIHDSIIFDGVDERQIANALELVVKQSADKEFQYICTFNSDDVPESDFSPEFDLMPFVRLQLTDASEDGCLLGKRF